MKEAIAKLTKDYEVGMKKGKQISVNRPVGGTQKARQLDNKKG